MNQENKAMPLGNLPAYMDSVRERGQRDEIPVVDMGMIVDDRPFRWARALAYSSVACLLVTAGAVTYAISSTESVIIDAGDMEPRAVAKIVSEEGGRVFYFRQNDDKTYEVRVFTFKKIGSLLDQLRGKKEFKRVEAR